MIIDLDAHQGNGHERDFTDDPRVYFGYVQRFDIPGRAKAKEGIRKNIPLKPGTGGDEYLSILDHQVRAALAEFKPDLIVYNAGTDCLIGDPLGSLNITADGIRNRDEIGFKFAKENRIPVVMVTSGGYQRNNAKIIANSILNLGAKNLISL